jgi:hypothetical protein
MFLFYHVWPILKDAEKWAPINVGSPASSKTSKSRLSQGSDSSSPAIDLNEDIDGYTPNDDDQSPNDISTSRPIGRKKEKMRRRQATEKNLDFAAVAKKIKKS